VIATIRPDPTPAIPAAKSRLLFSFRKKLNCCARFSSVGRTENGSFLFSPSLPMFFCEVAMTSRTILTLGRRRKSRPTATSLSRRVTRFEQLENRSLMAADLTFGMPPAQTFSPANLSASPSSEEPISIRIVNGTPTTAYPSVGIVGDNTGGFCTGTLIAPQFVLTAGHCAVGIPNTAGRFQLGSASYATSQVIVHPNYNDAAIGSDNANDIAIYKLASPVSNIAPSPIYRGTPQVGELLTIVGFGAGGRGDTGHDGSFGTKRVGTTTIDQVTPKLIHWNFDNNNESNTAPGDSGGPAFLDVGGVFYVAGVTSGGDKSDAGIGDHSFDTRVDAFQAWIDSIVTPSNTPVVSIRATDAQAAETLASQAANRGVFTVSRTGSTDNALTLNLTIGGTATNGTDYASIPASVTIPAGAAQTTIIVSPMDDLVTEGNETAVVTVRAGSGFTIDPASGSATVRIADNEAVTSNDNFANRRVVVGSSAIVTGSNVGATRETGEPNNAGVSGGKSVWWTWQAPTADTVTISTRGSSFDTTLGVYAGQQVNALTRIRVNDDENYANNIFTSKVVFAPIAGRTYQILVDGFEGDVGAIRLSIQQVTGRRADGIGDWPRLETNVRDTVAFGHSANRNSSPLQTVRDDRRSVLNLLQQNHDALFAGSMDRLVEPIAIDLNNQNIARMPNGRSSSSTSLRPVWDRAFSDWAVSE
jgi:secreted trypsin-like serine protease